MADISLVSRVRAYGEIMAKNMARTAGRPDLNGEICYWRIFAELHKPKGALSKVNLTSMEVSMF